MVDSPSNLSEDVSGAYRASQGVRVGSLTIVFAEHITATAARHILDDIAETAVGYTSVDAVKCDVAVFDQGSIEAFYAEAAGE